jgi:type IV secretory pathway TraG/TraD family ATPase VirD4
MSKDKKDSGGQGSDQTLLVIVVGGFTLFMAKKITPVIKEFWFDHRIMILVLFWFTIIASVTFVAIKLWNDYVKQSQDEGITAVDDTAVYLGKDTETGKGVSLKQDFRTMHAQVIGTTNAGKSESTIIPKAVQDIKNGSGVLLIDGKADGRFLDKLYAYVKKYRREKDFRLFSLGNVAASSSFNPLRGKSAQQVTERVFSSFTFENEYFRNVQYKYFLGIVRLVFEQKEIPTFSLVKQLLSDMEELGKWVQASRDELLKRDMTAFMGLSLREREERVSGIEAALSNFVSSEIASLFEETDNRIDLDEAMEKGHIVYFQLPTMLYPFLGSATGKLVLQCFQSAIAKRQLNMKGETDDESEVLLLHS